MAARVRVMFLLEAVLIAATLEAIAAVEIAWVVSASRTVRAERTEAHSAEVARAAGMRGQVNRAVRRASEALAGAVRVAVVAVAVAVGEGDSHANHSKEGRYEI